MRSEISPVVQPLDDEPSFIEAARRAQIIQCAIDAIAELGYQRASLYEIASRARVSKGVISYYFTSKDELIRQVVASVYATAREYMVPLVERVEGSAAAMLEAFIRANVAYMSAHRNQMLAIIQIAAAFRPASGSHPLEESSDQSTGELEQLMRYGQQTGEFRNFDPRVMAVALRSVIDAHAPRIADASPEDLERIANELVALFASATTSNRKEQPA